MKIAVVYILPHIRLDKYQGYARRFAATYRAFPPLHEHKLFVIVNGSKPEEIHRLIFGELPVEMMSHTNIGKDIGAYQLFASMYSDQFDLMCCFGTPVHFRKEGWLERIVEAYSQHGPGIYGSYAFHQPGWHIRTTNFWIPPALLNAYPYSVTDQSRYAFEHGPESITAFSINNGFACRMVTWRECLAHDLWHHVTNEDALLLDQHTDKLRYQ